MPRIVHFEITAEDPDRAAGFYVLGLFVKSASAAARLRRN